MRSRKVKVGIFLIGGAIVFTIGLFLIGNHNQLFAHHVEVYTQFAAINSIQGGAKVRVSGMDAGEVSDVQIPKQPSGKFRVTLQVEQKFHPIIRQDSVATIQTEGMVGNKFVNIEKGTNESPECDRCTLPSEEPVEMSQLMVEAKGVMKTAQGSIADLRQHADRTIDNIGDAGAHADEMIVAMRGNLEKIASNAVNVTSGVNGIVSDIRQGKGVAGKLLTDPHVATDVQTTIANAKSTTENLNQASGEANTIIADFQKKNIPEDIHETVANARDMSQELKGGVTHLISSGDGRRDAAQEIRQTIDEAHRASENLASDTEAIKHNFFLRGFFHRRGYYNLNHMNPAEYLESNFVKHPKKRIWLAADGLFEAPENGKQELSNDAQVVLDNAMSQIVDYLPNNPIVIEGYSNRGPASKRFTTAQQRADQVRKYLISHFQLNPDLIGVMPLEDKPPRKSGMESWDGVCIALVASHD